MQEWMHDSGINDALESNFMSTTIEDSIYFVKETTIKTDECHFAITDDQDGYMGTISLKHIDKNRKSAIVSIVLRRSSQGKGYASKAYREVLEIAKQKDIMSIYAYVNKKNDTSIFFHRSMKKLGFEETTVNKEDFDLSEEYFSDRYVWFVCNLYKYV